jgi:protein-disulfide isomerase
MLALGEIASGEGTAEAAAKFVAGYYDSFKPENRKQLPATGFPCTGPADAKITMVEFSDFDCPHCKAARPMFEKLVSDRHDLRLCFASFPLTGHKHSGLATAAALYAAKKGAFWKYHDLLFEDQDNRVNLDEAGYISDLVKLGEKAGLDADGLKAAITDPSVERLADERRQVAAGLGIEGTPYVYFNGRAVPPFGPELYKLSLDDEIEWMENGGHWAAD